ncbi:MAG: hypothetical protein LHW64_08920 [Candidatus Cloacimonetes bacterium]|nr:hypothetical protein [Candidatus Cloacimonadota bacterium]MDY0230235.1 hypothetical protein [Candidatus Cloacimonadaceae bacterium]
MNEIDILKSISENLSERKSTAALNNYEVLCNNIGYVNSLLISGTQLMKEIQTQINEDLHNDDFVSNDFKDNTKSHYHFRTIIPRILLNDINVIEKFISYTQPDDRADIIIETVGELKKDFLDFNNLVTSTRQFIDSLVADAYQLTLLEPKEINYQVLTSLNSFNKYATKSIRQALFNEDILNSLTEFESLSYNQRIRGQSSLITKCEKKSFGEKVDFLFNNLGLTAEADFKEEVKNLFSFSSEFTHIGYVSTFFTGSVTSEVIFTDDISPYLPSTENFSELKYEILETAMNFFARIYLPSIKCSLEKIFEQKVFCKYEEIITDMISKIETALSTRNSTYYFFIRQGLIGSKEIIDLTCICGATNHWNPPHDLTNIYCKNCGSGFNLIEVEGDTCYIMTSHGPIKVIGSSVPDFSELPYEEKIKLLEQCEEISKRHDT